MSYPPAFQNVPQPLGPGGDSTPLYPFSGYAQPGGYPSPGAMTEQPQTGTGYPPIGFAPSPAVPGYSPGLDYIATLDKFIVKQKIDILEVTTGWDRENEYSIRNSSGQDIFVAKEESKFWDRGCYGICRPFTIKIIDNFGNEVIHFVRGLNCNCCCCPCCLQELDVMSPPGTVVSRVIQEWSFCGVKLRVEDESGETMFKVTSPRCPGCGCSDVDFDVLSKDNVEIGKITKEWAGWAQESATNADNFSISFPLDLEVKGKAALLGALFLIDFMFFEAPNKRRHR